MAFWAILEHAACSASSDGPRVLTITNVFRFACTYVWSDGEGQERVHLGLGEGDPAAKLNSSSPGQAAQNLIVLAREEPGAEKIFQSDGVRLLLQLLDTGRLDMMLAALRTLTGLCQGHRARVSIRHFGISACGHPPTLEKECAVLP